MCILLYMVFFIMKETQRPYLRTHRPLSNGRTARISSYGDGFDLLACQREVLFLGSRGQHIGPALLCGVQGRRRLPSFVGSRYDMVYSRAVASPRVGGQGGACPLENIVPPVRFVMLNNFKILHLSLSSGAPHQTAVPPSPRIKSLVTPLL